MKHMITIIQKQLLDTLKNKPILIQFILFPLFSIIMTYAIQIQEMPENFFVNLFATMYIGMAPLVSISAIISEEKEKNNRNRKLCLFYVHNGRNGFLSSVK